MLDKIIASRTIFANIENQLADNIKLMEAGEDEFLLRDALRLSILLDFLLGNLIAYEFLQDIEQTVFLQDILP